MKKNKPLPVAPNPWKPRSSEEIYQNPWFSLHEDKVINPAGGLSHYGKIHFKNLAIGIIPLDENNNTWLVGQYRYVPDCYSWEIPMGGGWQELMKLHTSNSVTDERGLVYVARGLTEGETEFEDTEELLIQKLPLEEAIERVLSGEITDAISVAGLLKLKLTHLTNTNK